MATITETVSSITPQVLSTSTPDYEYRGPSKVKFDPSIHLNYSPPAKSYTFADLGVPKNGTSDFAICEPFQLATDAAILELRRELLQEKTVTKRMHWWQRSPATLRGFSPEDSPFTHAFWTSPEVIKIIERLTGIEMEITVPYEIGHTNVQVGAGGRDGIKDLKVKPEPVPAAEGQYDDVPVDNWHKDSFPYSIVMMMSNVSQMEGGETVVRLPDDSLLKVRGDTVGSAILIQGRHLSHAALRATNCGERITQTCPYRAKHPALKDDTEIQNSVQQSYLNELCGQYAKERFKVVGKKCDYMIEKLEKAKKEAVEREPDNLDAVIMDRSEVEGMMKEMMEYLQVSMQQLGMDVEGTNEWVRQKCVN